MEVFPDAKKLAQQYAVAEAKGIRWGILIGTDEANADTLTLKDLTTREQRTCTPEEAARTIHETRGAAR